MGGGRLWGISVTLHGITSSQLKNVGKIQLSIQLFTFKYNFLKYMVLIIIINSHFLTREHAANLFVHKMSSFRGLKKKKS